jgi:quercetin dioxygenase-like cupin family protein
MPHITPQPPRRLTSLGLTGLTALALGCLLAGTATVRAAPPPQAAVQQLLSEPLPDVPGKEVILLTVGYLPGGASLPHRHDADVFVYVLEGTLRMQVDGQPVVILHPGQTFHEGPGDIHRVSENASPTQAARFLVFMVKDVGRPVTRAADPQPSAR